MKNFSRAAMVLWLVGAQCALAVDYKPETKVATVPDPDASSASAASGSKVSVEAGEDGAKVKLRVTSDTTALKGEQYLRWAFGAEAPFDSDAQESADLGSLSGLSSGTKASLEMSWMYWGKPTAQNLADVEAICAKQLSELFPGFEWKDAARPDLSLSLFTPFTCNEELFVEEEILAISAKLKAAVEARNAIKGAVPIDLPSRITGLERKARIARREVASSIYKALRPVHLVNFGISANRDEFSYVLATAPTDKLDADKTGRALSISYTQVLGTWLWNVGYSREKSFQGGRSTEICSPIGTTGSLRCVNAVLGAPTQSDTDLAFGEVRVMFPGGKFAISPRVEYDANESEWGIRVPIYLAKNSSNEFTAGIALGYATSDDEFGISLFVGKPFEFFD